MDVQIPPPPPPPPPPGFFTEAPVPQFTASPPVPVQSSEPTAGTVLTTTAPTPTTQERIWLHPWTSSELRQYASNWSMAGDAGLLLCLEQFSETLVQRADAIQQHLNQTINAVKSTHTRVENCLNEFTSLANTQFIENRVYDEDETVNIKESKKDEQPSEKNLSSSEAQEKVLQRYAEAIEYGLTVLDTHFERVETKLDSIQNGASSLDDDGDDEDAGISIEPILEPKDPYILRPLPFLIGTTEFMQDDFVGLGDLLNAYEEDEYGVGSIRRVDSDTSLASSNSSDFISNVAVAPAPASIVPAGESRPNLPNQAATIRDQKPSMSSDDDEADIFGLQSGPSFNDVTSKTQEPSKTIEQNQPTSPLDFGEESDGKDDDDEKNLFSDSLSTKLDTVEPSKQMAAVSMLSGGPKGMSELEKAVLNRRRKITDSEEQLDDEIDHKPRKDLVTKVPATSNPLNLPSQSTPIKTENNKTHLTNELPIFNDFASDDDTKDDLFANSPPSKSTKTIPSSTPTTTSKPTTANTPVVDKQSLIKAPPKGVKTMFDDNDDDDDDDVFGLGKSATKKIESTTKVQSAPISKPKPIIQNDESDDDDEIFDTKPKPTQSKPIPTPSKTTVEKSKSPSSEEDLFKPPLPSLLTAPAKATKNNSKGKDLFDDEDDIPSKQSMPAPTAPVASLISKPSVEKTVVLTDNDSDDEIFGKSNLNKKPTQSIGPPAKPLTSNNSFQTSTKTESEVKKPEIRKPDLPRAIDDDDDDDDDDIFGSSASKLPTKKPSPINKTNDDTTLVGSSALKNSSTASPIATSKVITTQDPLSRSTLQPSSSTKTQTPIISSESEATLETNEEKSSSARQINPTALKDGEKKSVRDISKNLVIDPKALQPGAIRKKTVTEEPRKSAFSDNDTSTVNSKPISVTTVEKKPISLDSGSDDEIFNNTKKAQPTPSSIESKKNINTETNSTHVKDISSRIQIPVTIPGKLPTKTVSHEVHESNINKDEETIEISKSEPAVDKTMLDILKDKGKLSSGRLRAPPTRKARSSGIGAASSTNETDEFFVSSSSTNIAPSLPQATISVISSSTTVPDVSPSVPMTGLLNDNAANASIAHKQTNLTQKKKISLFDSDDSDIDELLFGSSKKNKSSVISKSTTTPTKTSETTTKASVLSLDDDDKDFLSKRPIKKSTKPISDNDIFADVESKSKQTNKAKKDWSIMSKTLIDDTDDIFNDSGTKSSSNVKSKSTTVKSKTVKNLDDIFDDPLNISSKR